MVLECVCVGGGVVRDWSRGVGARGRLAGSVQSLQVGERGEPRRNLALQRVAGGGEGAEGREAGEGGRQRAEAVVVDGKAAQGRGVAERGVGVEALDSVVGGQEHLPGAG